MQRTMLASDLNNPPGLGFNYIWFLSHDMLGLKCIIAKGLLMKDKQRNQGLYH